MSNYDKVKEWRKNNPEKVLEQARRYRKKHPETGKKAKEKYRQSNLEECRLREKEYQSKRRKNDPEAQKRYSPAECTGCKKIAILGDPDPNYINTSHVERQNLTMRMNMRRFTRLTNGFSKKIENHIHMVALNYMHYNFCRIHSTIKTTPAIAAGISSKAWTIADIVSLSEIPEEMAA